MSETLQKTVTVIPPKAIIQEKQKKTLLRVAAYCRVSTDDEEQLTSYKNQIEYYTEKIENNPEWRLIRIYADEGISGTSTKSRIEFNRMIAACRNKRIDLIITKSVSRFARNTVDCLKYVRLLRELGVAIYFEKENINTQDMNSELMLAFYGGFAQSESESISANVAWGKRKSFKDGKVIFHFSKLFGYRKGDDGSPEIIPAEAEVVKKIFRSYLAGQSAKRICDNLKDSGIAPPRKSADWQPSQVLNILQNEKYSGDAILQKTFIADCISKKAVKNTGELPMYLVQNNHVAIVSRELFNRVQEELTRRNSKPKVSVKQTKSNNGRFSCKYALTEIMVCGECGAPYRRVTWPSKEKGGEKRIVWRCLSRLETGTEFCKHSPTIPENELHNTIMKSIRELVADQGDIQNTVRGILSTVFQYGDGPSIEEIEQMIAIRNDNMLKLAELAFESGAEEDRFDAKYMEIANEIREFREQQATIKQRQNNDTDGRILSIGDLNLENIDVEKYSDNLIKVIVYRVKVMIDGKIEIKFKNDTELCMMLE